MALEWVGKPARSVPNKAAFQVPLTNRLVLVNEDNRATIGWKNNSRADRGCVRPTIAPHASDFLSACCIPKPDGAVKAARKDHFPIRGKSNARDRVGVSLETNQGLFTTGATFSPGKGKVVASRNPRNAHGRKNG